MAPLSVQGSAGVGSGQGVTMVAHQEHRQCTGTGVRQAGSLHWSDPTVLDIQQGEWEYQGILVTSLPSAAFPVSVLPDSLHLGKPTVFFLLFSSVFVDSDL